MSDEYRLVLYRGKWAASRDGKRTSLSTDNREEAERALADLLKLEAAREDPTCADIFERYHRDLLHFKKPGAASAENSWKALKATFGHLRPRDVSRLTCRGYIAARRALDRKDGTILRELGVLKAALRWHQPNTPAVFEMPPAPPPKEIHLTRDEFVKLREAAADLPHLLVFLELAKGTGARAGAILDLTWTRVDFVRGIIRLGAAVGNKGRATVPMNDTLREALLWAKKGALSPYVVEWRGGRVASVKKAFNAAASSIGRPDVGPHAIRHSVAVWMAEEGVPMSEISQYLGHASTAVTERVYARYSPNHLRRAASVLDF
jgi:integrase